ncbi:MAG: hypothetical protein A2017_18220 [Lentisphaerae bacterium GWF2_44_16]|nr:MAG: hypothetical protein A2017_18220 [Lentisphaerae bacterium GWF2_44_16]
MKRKANVPLKMRDIKKIVEEECKSEKITKEQFTAGAALRAALLRAKKLRLKISEVCPVLP